MVGLAFSRKNGSSSRWWVNDGPYKKTSQSGVREEGADTHLSHSVFQKMYSKSYTMLGLGLGRESIDRGELYSKNFIPQNNFLRVSEIKMTVLNVPWKERPIRHRRGSVLPSDGETLSCGGKHDSHSSSEVMNGATAARDIFTRCWVFKTNRKYQRQRCWCLYCLLSNLFRSAQTPRSDIHTRLSQWREQNHKLDFIVCL